MFMILLTFLSALSISAVSAWFSIVGIMAIFAGAKVAALSVGIVLEIGKLVSTSWLYRNWSHAPLLLRLPLVVATLVLMFITSMGGFGFLSKAHIEQGASSSNNLAKIERIDQQIAIEQARITDIKSLIAQLDNAVNAYNAKERIAASVALRRSQSQQRKELTQEQDAAQKLIDQYTDQKFELQSQIRSYELEVGPVKYIAALIYNDPTTNLESTVRIVTLIIVAVLDPFAVVLLIAANYSLMRRNNKTPPNDTIIKPAIPAVEMTNADNSSLLDPEKDSVPVVSDETLQSISDIDNDNDDKYNQLSEEIHDTSTDIMNDHELSTEHSGDLCIDETVSMPQKEEPTPLVGNYFNKNLGFVPAPSLQDNVAVNKPMLPLISGWLGINRRRR